MKQYKFESWFKGDVTLLYSEVSYKEENKPVIVSWENFAKSEVIKIKKKQSDIFHENVSLHLEKFKTVFNKGYNKSLMPEKFLEKEIEECYKILFEYTPVYTTDTDKIITDHWEGQFSYNNLLEIQEYANRTILKGIDVWLDFIHSPNNKYQIKDLIPSQIYAQLLYEYREWLKTNFTTVEEKITNQMPTQNESTKEYVIKPTEPNNKFPLVFKNGYAFEMFIELKDLTVIAKTELADYAFIFHKIKHYEYIGKDVKQKTFITILIEKFDSKISAEKLADRFQPKKEVIFHHLLKKYKPLIESVP